MAYIPPISNSSEVAEWAIAARDGFSGTVKESFLPTELWSGVRDHVHALFASCSLHLFQGGERKKRTTQTKMLSFPQAKSVVHASEF